MTGRSSQMLHTRSQGHWSFGSREGDFYKGFTLYGHGGNFGRVTITICYQVIPLNLWSLYMKFGFNRPSGF